MCLLIVNRKNINFNNLDTKKLLLELAKLTLCVSRANEKITQVKTNKLFFPIIFTAHANKNVHLAKTMITALWPFQ